MDPVYIGSQDILLDDITLIDCADADVPAGSDNLSCDFEEDNCAWYDDQLAQLKWQRADGNKPSADTGPGHDHTTGSGKPESTTQCCIKLTEIITVYFK